MRISDWSSDVCSSDLRNGLKQCFLAAIEPDDAPAAGNDGVDEAAGRDRASKRALAVALDISLQYLTLVDQGGAAFADAFLVEPLRQGESPRREGASARRNKATRPRRYNRPPYYGSSPPTGP